jgi:hypothetical protein
VATRPGVDVESIVTRRAAGATFEVRLRGESRCGCVRGAVVASRGVGGCPRGCWPRNYFISLKKHVINNTVKDEKIKIHLTSLDLFVLLECAWSRRDASRCWWRG